MIEKLCGIYQIRNIVNEKVYIGQSKSINIRKGTHFSKLRYNNGHNPHLQNAFNLYGEESFSYEILLICEESELTYYENLLIKIALPNCYNIREAADSNKGWHPTEEQKKNYKGNSSQAKLYTGFISPTGEIFQNIFNLAIFCKEHSLNETHMIRVYEGLEKQSKGWVKLADMPSKQFYIKSRGSLVSPEGIIYKDIKNISSFSKEHQLNFRHVAEVLNNQRKQHRGWTLLQE
jgi:group I intron endonuclease